MSAKVAVLFARRDSVYKADPRCDVYDTDRDARTFAGGMPVVAHPPCRAWGRFRGMAKPLPHERDLAFFAVDQVRRFGGVLEHPVASRLWIEAELPMPAARDSSGGWTLPIHQNWFGHRAVKPTLLYIVGIEPCDLPEWPMVLGRASHVIAQMRTRADGTRMRKGDPGWRPEVSKAEREHTPKQLATWLVDVAEKCLSEWRHAA